MFKSTSYFKELFSRTTGVLLSGILGLCLVFIFSWVLTANDKASALTSSTINYQARLLQSNGSIAPDGNYNVDFKLYSSLSTGGGQAVGTCTNTGGYTCLWEETYTSGNVVQVKDGYLTVNLGSITSFPSTINWGSQLYLTMNIGGTGGSPTWDGEMSPRIQLTSVPYAFESNLALTADTLTDVSGAYTDTVQLTAPTAASNTITFLDTSGTVCLQSASTCGFATGSGTAILQGGNSLGANVTIGSTTAYGVNLITSNATVESLSSTGAATFENSSNSVSAFQVQNASGIDVLNANTTSGIINIDSISAPGTVTTTLAPTISTPTTSGSAGAIHYSYEVVAAGPNGSFTYPSPTATVNTGNATLSTSNYNIVTWGAVTGVTDYYVYRSATTGSAPLGLIGVVASGTTTLNDQGQTPTGTAPALTGGLPGTSTAYYFKVTSIDGTGGQTTASAETSSITETTTTNNAITLSWAPVTGARGYDVYYATSSGAETNGYFTTRTNSYEFTATTGTTAGAIPTTSSAYNDTLSTTGNSQITIGNTTGSASTAQLDVAGSIPSSSIGTISTGSATDPYDLTVVGNYAYVIDYTTGTLQIMDVSNPANPIIVGSVATGTNPRSLYVQGAYAYVANTGSNTLQIFNVSNPASPVSVGSVSTGTSPYSVYVSGRYAYITNYGTNTLQIFDVSNPAAPISVGSVVTGTEPYSVYVSGNYAYLVNYSGNTLQAVNVSNPAAPSIVGTSATTGLNNPRSIYVQGRYAYVVNQGGSTLQVFDVSNPATPVSIGSTATDTAPYSVYVQGRYAYVANNTNSSFQVFDVSNPANLLQIGTNVSTGANPSAVYVSGRYAYVANNAGNSLQIFDLGGEYAQQLQAGGGELGTLTVDTNATVGGNQSIAGGLQVGGAAQISGNVGVGGNLVVTGSLQGTSDLGMPVAVITQVGAAGITSYSYAVTALNANGSTAATSPTQTTLGNATLNGTNYNTITWGAITSATSYNIYRTASSGSPGSTGLIGNTASTTFNDTGIAGTTAAPTTDTTGTITANGGLVVNGSLTATTANTISLTGGTGTAVSLISGASGTINVGNTSQSESINVGSTALATGTQTIDVGYTTTAGGTTNVNIGSTIAGTVSIQGSSTVSINAPTEQFTALSAGTRNINVAAQGTNVAGTNLTIQAGAAGTGAAAFTGGTLTLEGGNAAGTGNANGANVLLQGGAGDGTGVQGLVTQTATAFNSVTYTSGSSATITQADIDGYSTIEATASAASLTFTVPSPTITTAGRVLYVSNAGATNAFTVAATGLTSITLSTGSTANLQWNGTAWTSTGYNSGSGSYIQNQNASAQTANFDINGIGQAAGFDAAVAGVLNVGITTATSLQIGSTSHTTSGVTVSTAANYTVAGVAGSVFTEGAAITTGSITIGGTSQTGNITLGSTNTSGSTVFIANGGAASTVTIAGGTGGNTVNINTGVGTNTTSIGTAASVNGITIGSTTSTSSLTLQAGTGGLLIQTQGGTLGVGNNGVAQSLAIGNSTGATSVSVTSGSGSLALSTGSTTGNITLTTNNASSSIIAKSSVNTATAFVVQNTSGSQIFGINTTTGQTDLGNNSASPIAGSIVLDNGSNGTPATVTINANGSETSNFSITLPTTGASGGLCLESSTASTSSATTLQFNSCANNSPTISVDTINTWPKSGTATSGTTATVAAFTPSTDGDLLLVTTSIPASGGSVKTSPIGISDTNVTTWNKAIVSPASGSALRVEMWYGVVTGTTSAALTVTYASTITSGTAEVDVTEFTAVGVNSATTWGVDNAGATNGTATSVTPINMYNNTPGNSGELYYGFANDQSAGLGSGGSCPNVPSSGTTYVCTTSAGGQGNVVDYDLNTTAGTPGGYNGQIYLGATSYNYSAVAAFILAFVNSTAINNAVSTQEANFNVQAGAPGSVAGVLESNGSGDSLDLQNSAGVVASSFNSTGSLTVGNNSLSNQTASAVAFATPIVTYTVPNGYATAVGQTITVTPTCSGTDADSGTYVVTAVSSTTIAVSNTLGVAGETGCVVTTGSEGIINLEDENTAGTATGTVSLEAGIPSGSTSYNYSLLLPTTNPSTGLCLETSTASALQLVFNSCASNNPSISLQTTTGYGNNEWDTHAGTVGLTTTLTTYPETKGDLEVMTTQIPNATTNGVTVASVSGGGVTLWHKAAVNPGNSAVDRVEVWYGIITGLSPHSLASQTVSLTTFGSPNLTYTVPTGQPYITGEYITVTGCSGTGGDNGAYSVAGFSTTSITVSDPTNGVGGETGCTVNPGWPVTVTYTPSTPGAATEVTDSEYTAVGVLPSSSWGVDTSGNSLISTAATSLSGPNLTASTSGELYYSYANEQTAVTAPEGYATCTGSPAYNCIATGQGNVIDYNDQTVLSTAYQSAWTISPTALESNDVSVLFEAFISSTAINNTTSVQEANFDVQAATSGSVAGVLQANAAGNADILDLYNGGGTKEFTVSNTGLTTIGDSATISLIQSAWANATATGSASTSATSSLPLADWSTTQTKGDVVALGIECASTSASVAEITGGNVSNWYNVTSQTANGYDNEIWEGTITTTATATQINITYNLNGVWSANCEVTGQEFSASVPAGATPVWSVTSTSNTSTGTAATSVPVPTMTASQYGELYWSYDVTQNNATEPALQAPYFYQLTGDSKTIVYDTTFGPGTTNPTNNITQTSGTYNDVGMVLSASTGSNLTDNGGAIFTGSDAQTDLQVIGASGSGAAVLNADTLNNRVNIDGTLTILASPVLATPTAAGSGSTLVASQYCYKVTAIDGTGDETTASNEKCITPTAGQDITFTWGAVPGAVSYRVYRTVAAGATGSETFLYDATQLTFTDVGAYTPSGTIYPPSSTSAYGNSTVVNSATSGVALTTGINSNLQLTVGGNGSPTGQVYVSGTLPSGPLGTATIGGLGQPFGLAVQGNYAYISFDVTDTLAIYDVTNPANPVLVGQATTLAAPWYLSVSGHYVYITDRTSNALQIYDVSNPASPELISTFTTDMSDPSAVFISGNYAYITNHTSSTAGLEIVNVANPYAPTLASIIPAGTSAWNVFVQGRYAYVVQAASSTMYTFDVSNPNQPIQDSTFTTIGDASQIYVSGSYGYLSIGNDIQIINVDNPYTLVSADSLATNTGGEDCTGTSASYLEGHYLYVACDNGGGTNMGTMEQVDVTNPYSPVITGTVPVGLTPQTLWIQGRYAYVDDQTGFTLSVFDLGGVYSSSIQSGGLETGTLGVDSNALIGGTLSVGSGFTVGGSTDINGSLNAYGGAFIAGNVVIGASIGIPIPTSPTVTATCASACSTYYFYGVSATDSNGGTTLVSQPGGPAAVNGVPPVDYVENNSALSGGTNFNTIPVTLDQGVSDTISSYSVYWCHEASLTTGTPPPCSNSTGDKLLAALSLASETAEAATTTGTPFATPLLTYTLGSAPVVVKYQKVIVTGCSQAGDNGTFVVTNTTTSPNTVVVYDAGGTNTLATGCSIVGTLTAVDIGATTGAAPPTTTTTENSATAFQVQNAAGNSLVSVNTLTNQLNLTYGNVNYNTVAAPGPLTIGSYSGASGPNGTYYYAVTFVTPYGQTDFNDANVSALATTTGAQNINLTNIPLGPAGIVTARDIYRTKTGSPNTGPFFLVTTINNNTATTFTDTVIDGLLTTGAPAINGTDGSGLLQVNGAAVLQVDSDNKNVSIGALALANNTSGLGNFAIGYGSLEANTTGSYNYAIGANALVVNTTGSNNVALGDNDLELNSSGAGNIAIGNYTGENLTTGNTNILIGYNLSAISASTSNELNIGGVLQGNISTGSALFQNGTNSATAFVVETSGGSPVPLLTVNTTADDVIIGSGTGGDGTGYLLSLDNKNTTGDPGTEVNGAMYYNSYTSTFRCGQNGVWVNCAGGLLASNTSTSTINNCTTLCSAFSNNASLAANYCTPGRIITISMYGVWSNNQTTGTQTISLGVYWGTNAAKASDTPIGVASPAYTMGYSATNLPWSLNYQINCLTATTAMGEGIANFGGTTSTITPEWMNTSTATTITTTSAENIYVFPAPSVANAGITITANTISITGQ